MTEGGKEVERHRSGKNTYRDASRCSASALDRRGEFPHMTSASLTAELRMLLRPCCKPWRPTRRAPSRPSSDRGLWARRRGHERGAAHVVHVVEEPHACPLPNRSGGFDSRDGSTGSWVSLQAQDAPRKEPPQISATQKRAAGSWAVALHKIRAQRSFDWWPPA